MKKIFVSSFKDLGVNPSEREATEALARFITDEPDVLEHDIKRGDILLDYVDNPEELFKIADKLKSECGIATRFINRMVIINSTSRSDERYVIRVAVKMDSYTKLPTILFELYSQYLTFKQEVEDGKHV